MTRFLFAGDSVTDCGRTFFEPEVAAGELGAGWVRVVAGELGLREPERHEVLNAGVSGDRVADLLARWERDVLPHRPEVLTILIGVNDVLLEPITRPSAFELAYRQLLAKVPPTVERLVVAEPFATPATPGAVELVARLLPYQAIVRTAVASIEGATLLPLQDVFTEASQQAAPSWWADDGVHPTVAGHALLADTWASAVLDR